jgi:hypothetical protein
MSRPLYARLLRLRYLAPSGFLCFVFLEGAVALGILLALAELVSWWGVLVLPAAVAAMVKLNDLVTGVLVRPGEAAPAVPTGHRPAVHRPSVDRLSVDRAGVWEPGLTFQRPAGRVRTVHLREVDATPMNGSPSTRQWMDQLDTGQRLRQSANRRYE